MSLINLEKEKLVNYWIESSDDDYDTMKALFDSKRYSWTLFVGHLMIEKLLKALFVKEHNDYPPYIHNLIRLAEESKIEMNDEQRLFFATVTAFNINARYDDYRLSFQKKCTPEYTFHWFENIKLMRLWIKEQIKQ
jgi:HEPN domain-containing protein